MTEQLTLSLPYRTVYGREAFWVSQCNEEAIAWIDKYPDWPQHAVWIIGPQGSGKTHLVNLFSDTVIEAKNLTGYFRPPFQKKMVVENLQDLPDEEALLHLFNFVRELGGDLLLTSRYVPDFTLPDLVSRLNMIPKAEITLPDEMLMRQVAKKAFKDRHILVEESVLDYLSLHLTRSFPLLQRVVAQADKLALESGRKITIPVIRQVIQEEQKGDL